jgi:hypothetical protein
MFEGLKVSGSPGEGFAAFSTAFFGLEIGRRADYNRRPLGKGGIRGRHKKYHQHMPYSTCFERESTRSSVTVEIFSVKEDYHVTELLFSANQSLEYI